MKTSGHYIVSGCKTHCFWAAATATSSTEYLAQNVDQLCLHKASRAITRVSKSKWPVLVARPEDNGSAGLTFLMPSDRELYLMSPH